jgi:hypothetical protein
MSGPRPTIAGHSGSTGSPNHRCGSVLRFRVPVVIFVAAMIPATAHLIAARQSVRAQDASQEQVKALATSSAEVSPLIGEIQRILNSQNNRMATIAAPTLAAVDAIDRINDQLMDQMMATHAAQANYQDAKLSREIAEIEIIAYKSGIVVQELALAEGEVKLSQSELERAKAEIAEAKVRLGRISRYSNESPSGLNLVYLYTDRLKAAELVELKSKYVMEQAESKKRVLVEYTHPKRLKELQSDIEKKRSLELSKQADWDIQKSRLQKLQRTVKDDKPTEDEKQVLAMLDQAILLENTIRAELDRLAKGEKTDPPLLKEIRDLTNQLQNVVERAEAAQSAAQFAKLKPKIHRAAQR